MFLVAALPDHRIEGTAVIRRTARTGERYTANLYRLRPQAKAEAFDALLRALGLGVKDRGQPENSRGEQADGV